MSGYPEKHLSSKAPKRPRHNQGLTQSVKGKKPRKQTEPMAWSRVDHGNALKKALMGVMNRRHEHDGSK